MKTNFLITGLALLLFGTGCATNPKSTVPLSLEERFKAADKNGDGKVSKAEYSGLLVEEAFGFFDTNGNGEVTVEEFVASGGTPEAFRTIDFDGNGVITLAEAKKSQFARDQLSVAFSAADVDKDGYVTLAEAKAYREKAKAYTN